ncbi:hypothetical protein DYI22_17110 [Marinobacter lipolyticus]|nr:hypothetical protein [Marinobacter lipolyticus]
MPDASDRSVYSKPSVCTADISVFGDTQWGTKTKKNPGKNKNNADRQRFQGGFVQTDPPFDYWGYGKRRTRHRAPRSHYRFSAVFPAHSLANVCKSCPNR